MTRGAIFRRKIEAALLLAALPLPAVSEGIERVSYDALLNTPHAIVDFESFPTLPEPGQSLDGLLRFPGVTLGESFTGQPAARLGAAGVFRDAPGVPAGATPPLRATPGPEGRNLAVAFHAGFGSNALFPLGPRGFDAIEGRGEGMVSALFDADLPGFGVKLHAEYADPLGARPAPGMARFWFYDRAGHLVDRVTVALDHGVQALGFQAGTARIAGFILSNDDPGGIAIDDIVIPLPGLGS